MMTATLEPPPLASTTTVPPPPAPAKTEPKQSVGTPGESFPNFATWPPKPAQREAGFERAKQKERTPAPMPKPLYDLPAPSLTPKPLVMEPEGCRVDYAGKPGYVGARVWYITTKPSIRGKDKELEAKPGILYSRAAHSADPNHPLSDRWDVSVQIFGESTKKFHGIAFSETPQLGCWMWPQIPEVGQPGDMDLVIAKEELATLRGDQSILNARILELETRPTVSVELSKRVSDLEAAMRGFIAASGEKKHKNGQKAEPAPEPVKAPDAPPIA